jgi:Rps23 Pro-64 3,4-dihydroxylase Tpa1-like proline 4-hydroxylase
MNYSQELISQIISKKLNEGLSNYQSLWHSSGKIKHLIIDDLLPESLALQLYNSFPSDEHMSLRDGLQEKKYVTVNFLEEACLVERCLYAFQDNEVVRSVAKICNIPDLQGDPELYAGGVSSMNSGCYLNPHIDNSHDRLRKNYRRLNLLYYVSPGWKSTTEGCLQLWPNGLKQEPIVIPSLFNRLVIMATDRKSIHSVSKISSRNEDRRLCISNYFFSTTSPEGKSYYHSTAFRGFPDEKIKDLRLRLDAGVRTTVKSFTGTFFGRVVSTGFYRDKTKNSER